MSELMWVRSHVRQLLQEAWNVCRTEVDEDGDVTFRSGTAACWVSVLESEPVMVRVQAHAAYGLRPTAKVLTELNAVQAGLLSARIELVHGTVLVSQTISPIELTAPVLEQAVASVACVADDVGGLLAGMFDGTTPYPASAVVDESAA